MRKHPAVIPSWSMFITRTSGAMHVSFSSPVCYIFLKALIVLILVHIRQSDCCCPIVSPLVVHVSNDSSVPAHRVIDQSENRLSERCTSSLRKQPIREQTEAALLEADQSEKRAVDQWSRCILSPYRFLFPGGAWRFRDCSRTDKVFQIITSVPAVIKNLEIW